jgi:hypothetical protein
MKILLKSFFYPTTEDAQTNYFHHPAQILSVLLSASCIKDFLIDENTGRNEYRKE